MLYSACKKLKDCLACLLLNVLHCNKRMTDLVNIKMSFKWVLKSENGNVNAEKERQIRFALSMSDSVLSVQ